jgi:hypothetical protein
MTDNHQINYIFQLVRAIVKLASKKLLIFETAVSLIKLYNFENESTDDINQIYSAYSNIHTYKYKIYYIYKYIK